MVLWHVGKVSLAPPKQYMGGGGGGLLYCITIGPICYCGTTLQLSEGHTESQATLCYTVGLCSLGRILPLFKWVYKSVP